MPLPWMTPPKPKKQGEHAFGRDPDESEKMLQGDLLTLLIGVAIAWLVVVAVFSILFESVWPVAVGAVIPAALFWIVRAIWRTIRRA